MVKIDIAKLDDKIRKLQLIREFAADPDMQSILAEIVSTNGNGHSSPKKQQKGSLSEVVENACREASGKFTVGDIVSRLHEMNYRFAAKDEAIAVYSALRRLKEKGVIDIAEEGGPGKPAKWVVAAGQKHMKLDT